MQVDNEDTDLLKAFGKKMPDTTLARLNESVNTSTNQSFDFSDKDSNKEDPATIIFNLPNMFQLNPTGMSDSHNDNNSLGTNAT